jgi:ribonuclease P protein component
MSPMTKPLAFRPYERLRSPRDFRRVYDRRRSVSDAQLIVYGCENQLPYLRLGLSVSRKVGGAVMRNRFRRLYREAFRHTRSQLPGGIDLVLIPRNSQPPELAELIDGLARLVKQLARKLNLKTVP